MTGWDVLDKIINNFPPIAMALILVAVLVAVVILIVGFSRHGFNFLRYGFKHVILDSTLEKRFDKLEAKFDTSFAEIDTRIAAIDTRIAAIETNHFGHLKNFLTELTSILLDKNILNNQDKARLDNQLRGM